MKPGPLIAIGIAIGISVGVAQKNYGVGLAIGAAIIIIGFAAGRFRRK